ncbi:hypothetical protein SNE40_009033 [Patella caerulea]|uniref:Uncharacterized protein n=1 Tax=Patella caerulea TaxID=87958 RepID=A0AAN8JQA5_PATCE
MAEFRLLYLGDLSEKPVELLTAHDGSSFSTDIKVPTEQIILFALGKWPEVCDKPFEVSVSVEEEINLLLGSISENNRCIIWEKRDGIELSTSTNGKLARLVVDTPQLTYKIPVIEEISEIEQTEIDIDNIQAEMENTPQLLGTPSPLPKKSKQRKRNRDGTEKTPNGPTPQKSKSTTRMRALKKEFKTLNKTPKKCKTPKNVLTESANEENSCSGQRLSYCKDVTSRCENPTNRWGHTMCMVHNNKAVLIGGQGDKQQLSRDSVWSLSPDTRKWNEEDLKSDNQKPEYRMGHSAIYDPMVRCIYIYGGSKNLKWFKDVHSLDVDEWKWQLVKANGKAPTRAYHSATLYRHEVWIFGGVYPRPDPNPDGCSNDVHIFSPVMENWYAPLITGTKPAPRSGHSATLLKDQLVVFGGWDYPIVFNDLHILDMTTCDWSKPDVKGKSPKPRSWHSSCALSCGNRILIHGGYDGNDALEDSSIFNLDTLTWTCIKLESSPSPRAGHVALCLPYSHENQQEDEILVFGGGDNDGSFFNDLYSFNLPFNPITDE